jgi:hypothetical protein
MVSNPDFEYVPDLDSLDHLELVLPPSFSRCHKSSFELIILDSPASKAYPEPSRAKLRIGRNAA